MYLKNFLAICALVCTPFNLTNAAVAAPSAPSSPSLSTATGIEDTDDGWTWSGMIATSDTHCSGGSGRAGSPGTYGVYLFHGTGVEVYGKAGHNLDIGTVTHAMGKVRVSIDGHAEATVDLDAVNDDYRHKIFEIDGLKNKDHALEVKPVGGWALIDYIVPLAAKVAAKSPAVAGGSAMSYDFDDGTSSEWEPINGDWSARGGVYGSVGGSGSKTLLRGSNYHDVAVEADVAATASGNAGIIFRVSNPFPAIEGYYGYLVTLDLANQQVMIGKSNNSWVQLATRPYPMQANRRYRLKVVVQGTHIDAFVDGQFILSYEDTTYTGGAVGLRTFNTACGFDNVTVTPLDAR